MNRVSFRPAPLALAMALAFSSLQGVAQPTSGPAAPVQFNIAAQPLARALNDWARQTRIQLIVQQDLVAGQSAPAVVGALSPWQALDALLAGSGLVAAREGQAVIITAAPSADTSKATLPVVTVLGRNDEAATNPSRLAKAGALGRRSVLDTPFSISSVGSEDLEQRMVTNLEQAFRFDVATQLTGSEYGQGASFTVRGLGLDSTNGFKIDGLPIASWGTGLPMELFERVDLLKGLSGFMHGFGSPGGIANYVLKRPTDEQQFSASLGYKSDSLFSQAVDVGGRMGEEHRFGYRLNLVHEEGDTYINQGSLRRTAAALALDARLTTDLTATLDVLQARRHSAGNSFWGIGLSSIQAVPATVDPDIATQPAGSYYDSVDDVATLGLQWRMAEGWTTSVTYRQAQRDIDYSYSTLYLTNLAGDYTADQSIYRFVQKFEQWQALVEGEVRTGALQHKLTFGASRQTFNTLSDAASSYVGNVGAGNIYRDSTLSIAGSASGHGLYKSTTITQSALFASDTVAFNDQWSAIVGLRYNRFEQRGQSLAGVPTTPYDRDPLTPTLALLYKPTAGATFYASAVESLERGGTAGMSTANRNEVMGPIRSRQYELGYKVDAQQWSGSAALFRMDQTAEYVNAANYYVQDGITRYQGLELNGRWRVDHNLALSAGLMWLDSTYVNSVPAQEGKRTTGTPHEQAVLRADYRVPGLSGLGLFAGVKHVGSSQMNITNTYPLKAYTLLDAGASYVTRWAKQDVTWTAAVENLADHRYWVYNGEDYVIPGAPRTLSLNARVAF